MKLKLEDIASLAFVATGIGEKNTVSNGPDNGANNCQASHWWQVMRHGNTTQAVNNIINAPLIDIEPAVPSFELARGLTSTGAANIVGHANDGLLETGAGQNGPANDTNIIHPWNVYAWGPQFDRLQPTGVTYVSLWGCHPGAGENGAELVYAMAVRCGRAVRAGTGFLYCNNQQIWWENGSKWQVATPNHKPDPIPAPSPHFQFDGVQPLIGGRQIEFGEVESIEITPAGMMAKSTGPVQIEQAEAAAVLARLLRSPPIDLSGVAIPAMVTATIVVRLKDGSVSQFTVLNDRMAVEKDTGTAYYITSLSLLALR
jgi:hypothetical protein